MMDHFKEIKMSDESYRKGFLDGFREGWEKATQQENKSILSTHNKCSKCGMDFTNSTGYVCVFTNCPRLGHSVNYSAQFNNISSSNSEDLAPFKVKP
jgi:hypothetical protein